MCPHPIKKNRNKPRSSQRAPSWGRFSPKRTSTLRLLKKAFFLLPPLALGTNSQSDQILPVQGYVFPFHSAMQSDTLRKKTGPWTLIPDFLSGLMYWQHPGTLRGRPYHSIHSRTHLLLLVCHAAAFSHPKGNMWTAHSRLYPAFSGCCIGHHSNIHGREAECNSTVI